MCDFLGAHAHLFCGTATKGTGHLTMPKYTLWQHLVKKTRTTADKPEDISSNQTVVFFYETLFHTQQASKFVF